MVLDIGALLSVAGDDEQPADADAADDTVGPVQFDTALDISELPGESLDDGAEGGIEPTDYLVSGELPSLEADEDEESDEDERWELADDARDEDAPDWADLRWNECPGPEPAAASSLNALAAEPGIVVAGGNALLWLTGTIETPTWVRLEGGRVESLALVGPARQTLLCASALGAIYRWRAGRIG